MERTNRGMLCNVTQCFSKQFFSGQNFVPWGRARGVRQWNHIEAMSSAFHSKFTRDHFLKFCAVDKLCDGQSAHRNDETRLQNSYLIVHPRRAVANFIRGWNAVCAAGIFPRKTSAHRREIDLRSNSGFVHPAEFFEPAEKRFASGMRKWSLQNGLSRSWSLPNNHYIADDCAA